MIKKCFFLIFLFCFISPVWGAVTSSRDNSKVKKTGDQMTGDLVTVGANIVDVGIQTSTTTERNERIAADILLGQATGQCLPTSGTAANSTLLNGNPASYYATTAATGTITNQGLKTTNSPTFVSVTETSVKYSTNSIQVTMISTGVTIASMNGQIVDISCLGYGYIIKSWCLNANAAGTFTCSISTAVFSNTPSYAAVSGISPSLVSTVASSGTCTNTETIPPGGFLRFTCTGATVINRITASILIWVRK